MSYIKAASSGGADWSNITNKPATFPPSTHAHSPGDITGTAVVTNDARLSDARTPTTHAHSPGDITGTAVITNDSRLSDPRVPTTHDNTKHSTAYAPIDAPTFTGIPAAPTAAAGTNTTQLATCAYSISAAPNASYRTLLDCTGSHAAAKAAGTYTMAQGQPLAVTGTGTLYCPNLIYLAAADYPTVNNLAPKLRIRCTVGCNAVAPTGTYIVGLYPITSGAGGALLKIWNTGTRVSGSQTNTLTTPGASSVTNLVGSDFALPADGLYAIGVITTGTVATSALMHFSSCLQLRNA